jgi:hypothetical protein
VHDALPVRQGLQVDIAQPRAQNAFGRLCGQVMAVARACMVGVRMRDHRARHRPPGVDVEVAGRAIQALRPMDDEIVVLLPSHRD